MAEFILNNSYDFPPNNVADEDGLFAIGSNFNTGTLLKAYRQGIFPWYNEGELIFWYHPDPRFVLFPEKLTVKPQHAKCVKRHVFTFSLDKAFPQVIKNCRTKRKDREAHGLADEFENAYNTLFKEGFAHSAEAWQNNQLVGGLYGVLIGKVFFGESMFSNKSNASKFAFIKWIEILQKNGIELIDCQGYTPHLESLGAELIPRNEFVRLLEKLIAE